jgi:hypothetical protein
MIQLNAYYVLSDDFSLQAAFTQTEQQRHWDWTLLFLVSGMQQKLDADASLILPQHEAAYGNEAGFRGGVFSGSRGRRRSWVGHSLG